MAQNPHHCALKKDNSSSRAILRYCLGGESNGRKFADERTSRCYCRMDNTRVKKPDWLRVKLPIGEEYRHVRSLVDNYKLHTICESGNCPNMGECWGAGTATFMILGNTCTRSCGFCAVATGRPEPVTGMSHKG